MNQLFMFLGLLSFLGLSGCATKEKDSGYYERANKVSKEALSELDRD